MLAGVCWRTNVLGDCIQVRRGCHGDRRGHQPRPHCCLELRRAANLRGMRLVPGARLGYVAYSSAVVVVCSLAWMKSSSSAAARTCSSARKSTRPSMMPRSFSSLYGTALYCHYLTSPVMRACSASNRSTHQPRHSVSARFVSLAWSQFVWVVVGVGGRR